VLGIVTGMVAGLGTITPASGYVGPMGALVIGLAAGVVCYFATQLIKRKFVIDDSLDVFPVHGVGGILGSLIVAVFASADLGVFSGQGLSVSITEQFGIQLIGVAAVITYTAIITFVLLKVTGLFTDGIRVTEEEEQLGLDLVLHEETGYKL
jgi:Amt family ammonium transporter